MAKSSSFVPSDRYLCTASIAVFLIFCVWCTVNEPLPGFFILKYKPSTSEGNNITTSEEVTDATFYDDQETSYTMHKPMTNWDTKRKEWFKHHQDFELGKESRVFIITGSQPALCKHPLGDRLLLRLFKNKVDYCRINSYGIFYNNAHLEPKMSFYWAKIPIIRAAMVAHPEVEWFFWVDSDALFTYMEFKVPVEKYKEYNFVAYSLPGFYEEKEKSWLAVNAGIFLIRNCQWSMNFMEAWASMGPLSPDYERWGKVMKSTFKDKQFPDSDDQSALVYLLLNERKKWSDKIHFENDYIINGYWLILVNQFKNISNKYIEVEKRVSKLRRRHAEVVSASYMSLREQYLTDRGWRRPYITHFAGCQPCNGEHNVAFKGDSCVVELERALNFADNQVLRNYGFMRPDIANGSHIIPVPFDFPGDS